MKKIILLTLLFIVTTSSIFAQAANHTYVALAACSDIFGSINNKMLYLSYSNSLKGAELNARRSVDIIYHCYKTKIISSEELISYEERHSCYAGCANSPSDFYESTINRSVGKTITEAKYNALNYVNRINDFRCNRTLIKECDID